MKPRARIRVLKPIRGTTSCEKFSKRQSEVRPSAGVATSVSPERSKRRALLPQRLCLVEGPKVSRAERWLKPLMIVWINGASQEMNFHSLLHRHTEYGYATHHWQFCRVQSQCR